MRHISLFSCFAVALLVLVSCSAPAKIASADDWRGRWAWNSAEGEGAGFAFELLDGMDNPLVLPFIAYEGTLYEDTKYVARITDNTITFMDRMDPSKTMLVLVFDARKDGPEDDVLIFKKSTPGQLIGVPSRLPETLELTRDGDAVSFVMEAVGKAAAFESEIAGDIQYEQDAAKAAGLDGTADFPGEFLPGVYSANEGFSYQLKNDGVLMKVKTTGASVTSGSRIGTWEQTVVNAETGDRMLKVALVDEASGSTTEELWDIVATDEFQMPDGMVYKLAFVAQ